MEASRDHKMNDQLITPSRTPTKPENLVKIRPVDSEILWLEVDHSKKTKKTIDETYSPPEMHAGWAK